MGTPIDSQSKSNEQQMVISFYLVFKGPSDALQLILKVHQRAGETPKRYSLFKCRNWNEDSTTPQNHFSTH